jgi:uncharacterized repeat protein (TIGR01451 family)
VPRDLAADLRTPGTLYAALAGGVWRTVDAGGTWVAASTGLPSTDVRVLAADAQTPGRVLAGTAAGLARTANGGATWTPATGLPAGAVTAVAIDPSDPTIALAGVGTQGVWRSTDAGATWRTASTGTLAGAAVSSVLPTATVSLAGTDRGVFRSTDRGATWARVTAGLPEGVVATGLWQHPAVASTLVLAAGADGLYRSLDDGASWYRDDLGLDASPLELAGDARTLAAATPGDGVRLGTLRRDLTLTASAHPAPVTAGELVTLTFGVGNRGPSPSTGTRVAITVPAGFAVREATASQGTCTTEPLQCDLGTMAVGGIATATVIVRSTVAGAVPVTIAASADQPDRTPADDTRALDVQSTDTTPPRSLRVRGTTLQRPFQTGTDIQLGWSAVDSGTGVFRYDVRYRRATPAGRFEAATMWQTRTARTTALFSGEAGFTYCFAVRAVDGAGNESRYSTEKCTAIPLDDTALTRRGRWAREGSKTAFNGATVRSSTRGASLVIRNVRAKRISLLATTCKRCGTVEVRLGARLLKTVSLDAKTTRTRQVLPVLLATGLRSGTLTIRVTTQGRPVRIDGLGLSPR